VEHLADLMARNFYGGGGGEVIFSGKAEASIKNHFEADLA